MALDSSVPTLRSNSAKRSNEWFTPPHILASLPPFDTDPASPVAPIEWSTAKTHFTKAEDGLSKEWRGHVWLNPPYDDTPQWMSKLAQHNDGIALVFVRCETGWWFESVWPHASGILFLHGRVGFIPEGLEQRNTAHNAASPSALIAYGDWAHNVLASCPLPGAFVTVGSVKAKGAA